MTHDTDAASRTQGDEGIDRWMTIVAATAVAIVIGWAYPSLGMLLIAAIIGALALAGLAAVSVAVLSLVDRGVDRIRRESAGAVRLRRSRRDSSRGSLDVPTGSA